MKLFALMAVMLAFLTGQGNAGIPKATSSVDRLKVLMIGNSFSICVLEQMPQVAKAMGKELDICSLYIGGCSLKQHWGNVSGKDNEAVPYRVTWNYGGVASSESAPFSSSLKKVKQVKGYGWFANIPQMLKADRWDIVTVQQASHESWKRESFSPAGDLLVEFVRKECPHAQVVVQETWSYTPWDVRLSKWGMSQAEMYEKLHCAYSDWAKSHSLRIIPMGTAVQLYRKALPVVHRGDSLGGDPCGTGRFVSEGGGTLKFKGDAFHLNSDGHYLQALVWAASLFNADVAECGYKPEYVTEERAQKMKECAAKANSGCGLQM